MIRVLMWGVDDMFPSLAPFYEHYKQRGAINIIGYALVLSDTHTHTRGVESR